MNLTIILIFKEIAQKMILYYKLYECYELSEMNIRNIAI